MDEALRNETLKIREPYDPMFRAVFLLNAGIIVAITMGFGVTDIVDSTRSGLERIGVAAAMVTGIVVAYGLWRADLVLRVDGERIAARAWPFRSTEVSINQVLKSEVVTIDPMRDYRGWGLKGNRRDRLIGGGGTTALRVTYLHESGEERKLTFLTDRADEAERRITTERIR